jgi:hypothetical protein
MQITVKDLHKEHPVVLAAQKMVDAHSEYETMLPALECVAESFPEVPNEILIALWCGVNATNRNLR